MIRTMLGLAVWAMATAAEQLQNQTAIIVRANNMAPSSLLLNSKSSTRSQYPPAVRGLQSGRLFRWISVKHGSLAGFRRVALDRTAALSYRSRPMSRRFCALILLLAAIPMV